MTSEKVIYDAHRHHVSFDEKEKVIWLCGCQGSAFLPGEKEAMEKIFIREAKKQESILK